MRLLSRSTCLAALLTLLAPLAPAETFRNPRHLLTPTDPTAVLVADIDGDGRPDILYGTDATSATGAVTNGILHPLLAQPDGTFLPGTDLTLPTGISPRCLAIDLNLDHIPDLVCPTFGVTRGTAPANLLAATLLGDGHGHFTLTATILDTRPNPEGESLSVAATGDLNNDGFPDIVLTPVDAATTFTLLGDGTGHLTPTTPSISYVPAIHATLADLNGDGILDLIPSPFNASPQQILLGRGDGTFAPPQRLSLVAPSVLADLDGDGHLDLVSGTYSQLQILHGNPDGTFNPTPIAAVDFPDNIPLSNNAAEFGGTLAIVDLNADGIPDILASGGDGLTVLLGQPNLRFAPPVHYPVAEDFTAGAFFNRNTLADLNADGHLDLIVAGPDGLWITFGRADGTFLAGDVYDAGILTSSLTAADFNEDGNPDVVTGGDTAPELSLGLSDGTFRPANPIPSVLGYPFGAPIVHGDFNGDGHQDLLTLGTPAALVSNRLVLLGRGDGTFNTPVVSADPNLYFQLPFTQARVADLNRDGRDDVVTLGDDPNTGATTLAVSLATSDGHLLTRTSTLPITPASNPFLFLRDLDGDGIPDLLYPSPTTLVLLHGVGDGTFTPLLQLPIPAIPGATLQSANALTIGDFDGDGLPDIALLLQLTPFGTISRNSTQIVTFYNLGQATPSTPPSFSPAILGPAPTHRMTNLTSADLDGDGRADLITDDDDDGYTSSFGGQFLMTFHGAANRTFGPSSDLVANTLAQVLFLDLNHDTHPDLIAIGKSNAFTILLNLPSSPTPTATLTAAPEPSAPAQPFTLTATLAPPTGVLTVSGTATFSVDGTPIGSAPLSGNIATLPGPTTLAPGTHQLTATLTALTDGTTTYADLALAATHTVSAPIGATLTTLTAAPSPSVYGQPVTLTAQVGLTSATPTGTVQFFADGQLLGSATLTGGQATLSTTTLALGQHTLTATYAGSTTFGSSTSAPLAQTVLPASFTLALAPSALTLRGGSGGTITVTATALGTVAGPLTLTLGTMPPHSTGTLANPSLQLPPSASATTTIALTTDPLPPYTPIAALAPRHPLGLALALTGLPLLLLLRRRDRRHLPTLVAALLAVTTLVTLSGCSESYVRVNVTQPTTYRIPVTATDPTTGHTETAILTLTITP